LEKGKIRLLLDLGRGPLSNPAHCQKIKKALDERKFVRHPIAELKADVAG